MLLVAYMEYLAWWRGHNFSYQPACYQEFMEKWKGSIEGKPGFWQD